MDPKENEIDQTIEQYEKDYNEKLDQESIQKLKRMIEKLEELQREES
jgi:hypothetical protein